MKWFMKLENVKVFKIFASLVLLHIPIFPRYEDSCKPLTNISYSSKLQHGFLQSMNQTFAVSLQRKALLFTEKLQLTVKTCKPKILISCKQFCLLEISCKIEIPFYKRHLPRTCVDMMKRWNYLIVPVT